MNIKEIKLLNKKDLVELLELNTKTISYNTEVLKDGYAEVFKTYVMDGNYILEESNLWSVILMGFYNFEPDIVDAIKETMGWYDLMVWCFSNLKSNLQIEYYFNRYYDYHKEKVSTAEILSTFITNFVEDFGELDPENVSGLISQLGTQLKALPDIVKNN
jgi:hypothetical protein